MVRIYLILTVALIIYIRFEEIVIFERQISPIKLVLVPYGDYLPY